MIFNELDDSDANLTLLLRNQISQADRQQQPSYLSWDALNNLMQNIGDEQFDYDSFKNSYDTNPMIKQLIQRFDARGVELKTKNKNPKKGQPGGEGEVAKMAKAATARRQNESYSNTRQSLFEGLDSQTVNEALVWKRILRPIVEAQLTPDQINTLFQQAQQVATASGGNRTGIGKGVDYVAAKAEAWEKIKTALQNTGPISGFEAQYDKLAAKLKEKTGGDQGIMKYIQMYRDFATKNPKFQKFVYGVAIAGVGILALGGSVAAMSGGPVILGLLKMTDRLLQGDKLTSAIWQGVKTGALAAVGVGVGKGIRNMLGFGAPTGVPGPGKQAAGFGASKIVNHPDDFGPTRGSSGDSMIDQSEKAIAARSRITNAYAEKMGLPSSNHSGKFLGGVPVEIDGKPVPQNLYTKSDLENISAAKQGAAQMDQSAARMRQATGSETPAQQSARYAKNDVGNTPGQQATKDALRAGNAADAMPTSANAKGVDSIRKMLAAGEIKTPEDFNKALKTAATQAGYTGNNTQMGVSNIKASFANEIRNSGGDPRIINQDFIDKLKSNAGGATSSAADFESAYESRLSEQLARQLTESQIRRMFYLAEDDISGDDVATAASGAWGAIKKGASAVANSKAGQAVSKGAGAVAQKVGTAATNITTKVTADKLMKAWKAAKSPTDSAQVYKIMKAQGLDDATLTSVFKTAGIEVPPATPVAAPAPTAAPAAGKGFNVKLPQKAAAAPAAPAPAPAPSPQSAPAAGQETDAQRRARIKAKQQAFKAQQGLKESIEYLRLSLEYNKIKS
jgi:hypothetical protein